MPIKGHFNTVWYSWEEFKTYIKNTFGGRDKLLHIAFTMLIELICFLYFGFLPAVLVGALIPVLKEFVWDKALKKGTFDYADLAADGLGWIIGIILIAIA